MEKRALGALGFDTSVLIYGAAMLGEVDQDTADASIQQALDAGINHFDTAAGYGESELRLGPWMPRIRDQIFLATKTQDREVDAAWASINRSLERLQTDHVELIQLHAIGDLEELDKATGPGGSLEAAIRARDEGLATAIGITGHGHDAPDVHREALRRFDFQAVLTPWSYVLSRRAAYGDSYRALAADCAARNVALRLIKTVARRNWPEADGKHAYATWYEPLDQAEEIRAAVSWALAEPVVSGLATPGDVGLLGMVIAAEADRLSVPAAEAVLDDAGELSSPFISIPI
ncbi:MAG: aldo/keto reductase [Actinomycetota bacterium]|nr:aldo/keto reductase [Actinomycetota bacterium]